MTDCRKSDKISCKVTIVDYTDSLQLYVGQKGGFEAAIHVMTDIFEEDETDTTHDEMRAKTAI